MPHHTFRSALQIKFLWSGFRRAVMPFQKSFPHSPQPLPPNFIRVLALPAVNRSAADSPTIRPTARITPVRIPDFAEGSKIVRIIYHFVAPSPTPRFCSCPAPSEAPPGYSAQSGAAPSMSVSTHHLIWNIPVPGYFRKIPYRKVRK